MNSYYNIHNIFSIQINGAPRNIGEYILRELEYFETTKREKVNLKVIFTDKITFPDSHICLLRDLYYKEGIFYFIFPEGILSIPIKDLPNEEMTIIAEKSISPPMLFAIIEKIMFLKLLEKDFCLLHAACCDDGKQTILYSSLPGTGKTNWVLDKCNNGASFLSDDSAIIDKNGNVFAYPRAFTLGKQHKDFFSIYLKNMRYYDRFRHKSFKCLLYLFLILAMPFPKLKRKIKRYLISMNNFRVRIKDVIPELKIAGQAKLNKIMLVFNLDTKLGRKERWDAVRMADFLIDNSNRELSKFIYLHFMAFLSYGDDYSSKINKYFSELFSKQKKTVYSLVDKCQTEICYNSKI